jgi:2-keto-3-deoxy-6-phosphogluconate aldolase
MSRVRPPIPDYLEASRIVAILRRTDPEAALATAEALLSGGITCLEVTCDSPGALEMIRAIADELGERALVGAGTVLDRATAQAAVDAGAQFIVSPTWTQTSSAHSRCAACRGFRGLSRPRKYAPRGAPEPYS